MMKLLVFCALLAAVYSQPIKDDVNQDIDAQSTIEDFNNKNIAELKDALNDVAYVQNFKTMMADYVKSQYKSLTEQQMETIKQYLEEFCHKFAIDLKNIVDNGVKGKTEERIEDGLPDSTFESVKECIKQELPAMEENTVAHIVYALRKNLFQTRQKIDKLINDSKVAAVENQ